MKIEILPDAAAACRRGAEAIAAVAREAIGRRGRCVIAVSGGRTPWQMLEALAREPLPWERVHVVQADERVAPEGHAGRNLTHLREHFLSRVALPAGNVHAMPVEQAPLELAARRYGDTLVRLAGAPVVLDLVQLGLGNDGHAASLVPGDPVLEVGDADVAVTGEYEGRRRMTLTIPAIDRARAILWLVTGEAKASVFSRFCRGDASLPAARIARDRAIVLADHAAAARLAEASS